MKQQTLATTSGFERYTKKTKRGLFLEEMEPVVPWRELCGLIEPYYPQAGNGRRPVGAERMLRIYFLQQWFSLSDPAVEEALYDSPLMRRFAQIDLGNEPVPDETTVCRFRHLLEEHALGGAIMTTVNEYLQHRGLTITAGTIVDATIIHAPSSTKNRDPEMHQTKKGKQWYFGMKAHVGVDNKTKLIHTAVAPLAQDMTHKRYRYKHCVDEVERAKNRVKSKVRSKVEHVFGVMKLTFGFVKARYRELAKNANRLFATCALVNLFMVRKKLLCPVA